MITNFEWIQIFIAIIMAYILGIGMGIRFESKKDYSDCRTFCEKHYNEMYRERPYCFSRERDIIDTYFREYYKKTESGEE